MQSRTILYFLFLLAGSYVHSLHAQQKGFSNFSVKDGLAQSKVSCLLEDSRGILWIGTQSAGLSRYDGHQFKTLTTSQGLVSNYILSLFEDQQGRLWIGTKEGISLYDGEKFNNIKTAGKQNKAVHAIWQEANGTMWIGTNSGIYTYTSEGINNSTSKNTYRSGQVHCIFGAKNGAIWIGHSKGLLRILGNERKTFTAKEGLNSPDIRAITEDSEGNIWTGSILGGVHKFDGKKFLPQFVNSRTYEGFILDLAFDASGDLWIATQSQGLAKYDNKSKQIHYLGTRQGLAHRHVTDILEDSWGNIWMATLGGGISKYTNRTFIHLDKTHGLPSKNILSMAADSNEHIWMGVSDQGVAVYNSSNFQSYSSLLRNVRVTAIHKDRQNRMWLGTDGRGLALFEDTAFHFFPKTDSFQVNFIRDLAEDAAGNLWIASKYHGVFRVNTVRDSLGIQLETKAYTTEQGLISDKIACLLFDLQGQLWYGTADKGIAYFDNKGQVAKMAGPLLEDSRITTMAEDSKGYLWVGTAIQGLQRIYLHDKTYTSQSFKGALVSEGIKSVLFDKQDRLWVGSERGLDRISLDAKRNFEEIRHFGRAEGLLDTEMNRGAMYQGSDGKLYLGANSGLSIYQAQQQEKPHSQPRLHLEQVKLFYEPLQENAQYKHLTGPWGRIKQKMNFESQHNHLSFEFNGIDMGQNGSLKYQFRMKGLEKNWSPPDTKKDAAYPNLTAGDYTFQVKAINSNGTSSEVLEIPFYIEVPFYLRKEFIAGAIALLALLIWIIFKVRLNQVRAIARIDQEKLSIEKDLVQLEQKALRLQMNPHFLFNALNSIQGLISREDSKNARYYLAKFSKLMRMVLENSRESMIPLSDEIETLEHYLTVELFSSGDKFSYDIKVDENLDPDSVLIPPMMIQPFIENAIIHGIAHLKQKGKIEVEFRKIGKRIECYISDNGVGRKKAKKIKSQQAHKHKSTALLVTQERLDILSKGADWGKSIEMVDLADASGDAAGTKVILRIPLILDI